MPALLLYGQLLLVFLALGILSFYRLLEKEGMKNDHSFKWMIPLSMLIGLSVVFGFALPKSAPIWPDPVPFIQSLNETTQVMIMKGLQYKRLDTEQMIQD